MRKPIRPVWLVPLMLTSCAGGNQVQDLLPTWSETSIITALDPGEGEQLGYAIALSGDGRTLAVGAPMNSSAATGIHTDSMVPPDDSVYSSGAVYVYVRTGDRWTGQALIKASTTDLNDQFGGAVAISGDGNTLAVSAAFEDSNGTGIDADPSDNSMNQSGAVYIFTREGAAWEQVAYIKASNTGDSADGDTFGYAISLSDDGNTLGVGAPSEDSASADINGDQNDNGATAAGAVYVFARTGDRWAQRAYLKNSNNQAEALFGYAVAVNATGDTLAASAYDEEEGSGAVYVFSFDGVSWSEAGRLRASNSESQDSMGVWIGISDDGDTIAVGAPDEDSVLTGVNGGDLGGTDQHTNVSTGAVYVFSRSAGGWAQEAFIKASNTGIEDWFGVRLALAGNGNTLAAAAPNEDSVARGIGGEQGDDSAQESGALYMFERRSGNWTQTEYVKGSNTGQFDEFGSSVALDRDGTVLAVGARFDDGAAFGSGDNSVDDSIPDSGAVYVFSR